MFNKVLIKNLGLFAPFTFEDGDRMSRTVNKAGGDY